MLTRFIIFIAFFTSFQIHAQINVLNVRSFGAIADGVSFDTKAINAAIEHAAKNGGGTIYFPPGKYLSGSIRMKSNITLYLDNGTLLIAAPSGALSEYDEPEHRVNNQYEDFGHRHWHNSLIWGENVQNIAIVGNGTIWGKGLERENSDENDKRPNKTIGLYRCRNVLIRDINILHGGWFCLLATGTDNLTIDNVKMDTNRDAIDIDCCHNVRISNCSLNAPGDDALVLKSSFALNEPRATENVTITNCHFSAYDEGTMLDGTRQRLKNVNKWGPNGRLKFGTESNGGFRNIVVSNCTFEYSRGLALETVDGALLENISIMNITMKDVGNAPIFLRLARRMRGPSNTPVGELRRVRISNLTAYNVGGGQGILISGVPGHPVEDIELDNISMWVKGGGKTTDALRKIPGMETGYPEPFFFGIQPAYAFFIRNARNLKLSNINVYTLEADERPVCYLEDVHDISFLSVNTFNEIGTQPFIGGKSSNIRLESSLGKKAKLIRQLD
ncbi:rhamnogalacturonidase [Desertivirga xinjiangensis]|uniref:rhamnogalacturonidase n=1 Tax=Desertivirga xinjiangensis TaxID=539206 RepID=UPI0021086689|nr:glycoside hydrolase family 28 protein [Pedobacter xinjiangensis]